MNFINISKGALAAVLLALAVSACSDVDFPYRTLCDKSRLYHRG